MNTEPRTDRCLDEYVRSLAWAPARTYALRLGLHLLTPGSTCLPTPPDQWASKVDRDLRTRLGLNGGTHRCACASLAVHLVDGKLEEQVNTTEAHLAVDRALRYLVFNPTETVALLAGWEAQTQALTQIANQLGTERAISEARMRALVITDLDQMRNGRRDRVVVSTAYHTPGSNGEDWQELGDSALRALRHVDLFTSMDKDTIEAGDDPLRRLLRHGRTHHARAAGVRDSASGGFDSLFEQQVHEQLTSWGLSTHTQVWVEGYRVDLAVCAPEGGYALGIECDGATWHSSKEAKTRDEYRQQVLEGAGWRIHRINSTTWFQMRDVAVDQLRAVLGETLPGQGLHGQPLASTPS